MEQRRIAFRYGLAVGLLAGAAFGIILSLFFV